MPKVEGTVEEDERRFGRGRYPLYAVAPGRWVNPLLGVLGAVVLSGYLMTGHLDSSCATPEWGRLPVFLLNASCGGTCSGASCSSEGGAGAIVAGVRR